jgi:hypothetical protein
MRKAGIAENLSKPKALRHTFALTAGQSGIPLDIVQRWLGQARIETTAIYASAIGDEERNLARSALSSLELAIRIGRIHPIGDASDANVTSNLLKLRAAGHQSARQKPVQLGDGSGNRDGSLGTAGTNTENSDKLFLSNVRNHHVPR